MYSDGFCEQGGFTYTYEGTGVRLISLPKPFLTTHHRYVDIWTGGAQGSTQMASYFTQTRNFNIVDGKLTSFEAVCNGTWEVTVYWRATGYVDVSQYKQLNPHVMVKY